MTTVSVTPRLHWHDDHGAAAAQRVSAAHLPHAGDRQGGAGLRQSAPLRHGPQDPRLARLRHRTYTPDPRTLLTLYL